MTRWQQCDRGTAAALLEGLTWLTSACYGAEGSKPQAVMTLAYMPAGELGTGVKMEADPRVEERSVALCVTFVTWLETLQTPHGNPGLF